MLDEDLIKKIKEAGCSTICLGIESGSNKILKKIDKGVTRKDIIKNVSLLKKYKIWFIAYIIVGNPEEGIDDVLESFSLCKVIMPELLQLHFFKIYSDSPIQKKYKKTSYLSTYEYDPACNLSKIQTEELIRLYKSFYKKYYFSLRYLTIVFPKIGLYYLINLKFSFKFILNSLRHLLLN